jgi:hypothetical protein
MHLSTVMAMVMTTVLTMPVWTSLDGGMPAPGGDGKRTKRPD